MLIRAGVDRHVDVSLRNLEKRAGASDTPSSVREHSGNKCEGLSLLRYRACLVVLEGVGGYLRRIRSVCLSHPLAFYFLLGETVDGCMNVQNWRPTAVPGVQKPDKMISCDDKMVWQNYPVGLWTFLAVPGYKRDTAVFFLC